MSQVDLDTLREVVLDGRRGAEQRGRRRRVFVDPGGRIVIGDDLDEGEDRQLSEVHPAVFAAPPE